MTETVSAIRRVLSQGSSFPSVVATTSGHLRVMKLAGAGPGRRALAIEYIALKLARRLGLRVPEATLLDLPAGLPWQVGTDEFYEAVERSAGFNLGVAFIADARDLKAADLPSLPADFLARLGAVDALLQNVDRTVANPNVIRDAAGVDWAIDFGACLLIDRLARGALEPRPQLPPNHFLAGTDDVPISAHAVAAALDEAHVAEIVGGLPEAWLDELGLSGATLSHRLRRYAEGLRAL